MSNTVMIGVDHGYAATKTTHFSFSTGLVGYEHEPYTRKDVLELDGRYYVVGTGRQPLQKDKTVTEDYYLLTLAAIAKELEHRQAGPTAAVHLAAGLPLWVGAQAALCMCLFLVNGEMASSFFYVGIVFVLETIFDVAGLLAGGPVGDALLTICRYFPRNMLDGAKAVVGDWMYLGKAWLVGAFWVAVCTAIGLYGFRKKEIK